MGRTKVSKHLHRIIRLVGGPSYVYKCADGNCKFLIHHAQLYHLIGRACQCMGCGETFPFTESCIRDNMTLCDECITPGLAEVVKPVHVPH